MIKIKGRILIYLLNLEYLLPQELSFMNKSIYCECHEECLALCINPKCILPAMICQEGLRNNSPCGHDHQNCKKTEWRQFQKIVNNNPRKNTPQFHSIESTIDHLFIDLISKIREEHTHFKFWLTTYSLSEQSVSLITSINLSEIQGINGRSISHLVNQLTQNNEKIIPPIIDEKEIQRIKETIQIQFVNITQIYLKKLKDQQFNGKNSQLRQSNSQTMYSTLNSTQKDWLKISRTKFSTIIQSPTQIAQLFSKKIKDIKILYRASENIFSTSRFHELCDNVPNTVTLVKNQFGRVFGGFTPLKWSMHKKGFQLDTTQQSFLFGLYPQQKYRLTLSQFAIANNIDSGPIFGCNDLVITDESDKNLSRTQFPICYKNDKAKRSADTSLMFSGSKIRKFLIKEWQVFVVEFEQIEKEVFIQKYLS